MRGDRIETVDVTIGGRVIHLKDVYIGSFDISKGDDPTVSFTLNFGSIEYGDGEKKGEVDTPARGAYGARAARLPWPRCPSPRATGGSGARSGAGACARKRLNSPHLLHRTTRGGRFSLP